MSSRLIEEIENNYLTKGNAAKALHISEVTLWRWIKSGKVQAYRIGREVLIEKAEVEKLRR